MASTSCTGCSRVRTVFVWVDVPAGDEEAVHVLSEVFRFHPLSVKDAVERNCLPKMHAYHDHVFVIVHAPERGKYGQVQTFRRRKWL